MNPIFESPKKIELSLKNKSLNLFVGLPISKVISLAGVIVLIMIGLYIRSFFYRRKQHSDKGSDETVIDAEYTILDNKDSDD